MTAGTPEAFTFGSRVPSAATGTRSPAPTRTATGGCSTTSIRRPCGKSVSTWIAAIDTPGPIARLKASSSTCSVVIDWAARVSRARTRGASVEVTPVISTSRTSTSEESRNQP
jgi:hypothetical protein